MCFVSLIFLLLARSPIFTHLSSSMIGLTTVRAHELQVIFQRIFDEAQDVHSSTWYMYLATSHWFGFYSEWICNAYLACVILTCMMLRECMIYDLLNIN
jgi:ATP-binding cassette subfamily C (CFTR/MRP) protein 4